MASKLNGKKKGILKQMVKPSVGKNKFRGVIKPKYPTPIGELAPKMETLQRKSTDRPAVRKTLEIRSNMSKPKKTLL
jgi:hypothetical protein